MVDSSQSIKSLQAVMYSASAADAFDIDFWWAASSDSLAALASRLVGGAGNVAVFLLALPVIANVITTIRLGFDLFPCSFCCCFAVKVVMLVVAVVVGVGVVLAFSVR